MNKFLIIIVLAFIFTACPTAPKKIEEIVGNSEGTIYITSDPVGAEIFLNDENTGKVTPDSLIELFSDEYSISLKLDEFIDSSFSVYVEDNQRLAFDIFLNEVHPNGKIILTSDPSGASISINGVNTGQLTPSTFSNLKRGQYNFSLNLNLYDESSFYINLTKDGTLEKNTRMNIAGTAGTLYITSNPTGASIFLDNFNTGLTTPDTLKPLTPGNYSLKLSLEKYNDTTFVTQVSAGGTTTKSINMRPLFTTTFSNTIWETIGTTSEQPSGLDLSSAITFGLASSENLNVDLFYNSNGFVLTSANGTNGMTRETYFKVGESNNLNDGINSLVKDNTWVTSVPDTETNYIFLYDADGHYSKFIIVDIIGGTPGDPVRLQVKWLYNNISNSRIF